MDMMDIELDLQRGASFAVAGLRDAFAALKFPQFENILYGNGNPIDEVDRLRLLCAVCEMLIEDDELIPRELCAKFNFPEHSTYADGVLVHTMGSIKTTDFSAGDWFTAPDVTSRK